LLHSPRCVHPLTTAQFARDVRTHELRIVKGFEDLKHPTILSLILVSSIAIHSAFAAEHVYTNGRIYTANSEQPWAEAILVKDEKILYVGTNEDALQRARRRTTRTDLDGKFVMPGIIDTHTHPGLIAALWEETADITLPQTSHEELLAFLREYAKDAKGFLITLGEWNVEHYLPDGPHKSDLDAIFPDKPVALFDNSGHTTWLNSRALALFNITRDTPDLSENISEFVRDKDGELTGWVKEFALIPYVGDMTLPTRDQMKAALMTFVDFLSAHGVTSLMDAGSLSWHNQVYDIVAELEREGTLPVRYEGSYHIYDPNQLDGAVKAVRDLRKQFAGDLLTFNTVKIHYDGVLEVNTAGQLDPYHNEPDSHGGILIPTERLTRFILELEKNQIDLHLHSVGDRATRSALDAVEQAKNDATGPLTINISLSHLEQVHDADIPRFAELNVSANFTPHWFGGYFKGADQAIGPERNQYSQRAKTFVNRGARVTFSSDVTVLPEHTRANPFFGMQIGVTRQNVEAGPDAPVFGLASERLAIEDLLVGYSRNAAAQLGRDVDLGTLEAGKLADFIVLDRDPTQVDDYQIHEIKPVATVLGGMIVHGNLDT